MTTTITGAVPGPTWFAFLQTISARTDGRWLFRGQSDSAAALRPGAGRPERLGGRPYNLESERELFREFKAEALRFNGEITTDLELLALAQHHGLPTRLLDWSFNPLVAAWFACQRYDDGRTARIHMIYSPRDRIRMDDRLDPFSDSIADVLLARVPARAARITAQEGVFSLHADPAAPWDPSRSTKVVEQYDVIDIPADEKLYFNRALRLLGITHARMMGGLDGVCDTLAVRYRDG